MSKSNTPIIYVISDSIGETAELVARAAASQFNSGKVEIRRVPYVNDRDHLAEIVEEAADCGAIIGYTLVLPEMKQAMEELALARNLVAVDILGPMLEALGKVSGAVPKLTPGLVHQLDEHYYRRVEAVEFAVKYDDGKDPRGLTHADIILIGVSRTSKTPLSMYLAHKKLKVANVPLVPEVAPPDELFQVPPDRIIGLAIRPGLLNEIRQERLKTLGLTSDANYASLERIEAELEYAEKIMRRLGCPVVDVTNKAVEETASKILQIYYKGDRYGR
jgi:regulator of PEP synthase PpsR (kinase-PPPase family)